MTRLRAASCPAGRPTKRSPLLTGDAAGCLHLCKEFPIRLWNWREDHVEARLAGSKEVACSPDGKVLGVQSREAQVAQWDWSAGRPAAATPWSRFPPDIARPIRAVGPAVTLLDPANGRPLATLHSVPPSDWLIETSDGRYDVSPVALGLVRWRVGGRLCPAEQYAGRQQPEAVRRALAGER